MSYPELAAFSGLSMSEVHGALKRAEQARLLAFVDKQPSIIVPAFRDFLLYGRAMLSRIAWCDGGRCSDGLCGCAAKCFDCTFGCPAPYGRTRKQCAWHCTDPALSKRTGGSAT